MSKKTKKIKFGQFRLKKRLLLAGVVLVLGMVGIIYAVYYRSLSTDDRTQAKACDECDSTDAPFCVGNTLAKCKNSCLKYIDCPFGCANQQCLTSSNPTPKSTPKPKSKKSGDSDKTLCIDLPGLSLNEFSYRCKAPQIEGSTACDGSGGFGKNDQSYYCCLGDENPIWAHRKCCSPNRCYKTPNKSNPDKPYIACCNTAFTLNANGKLICPDPSFDDFEHKYAVDPKKVIVDGNNNPISCY